MRTRIVLGAIAAATLATTAGVVATQAGAEPAHHGRHAAHFTVVEHAITDTTADTGPKGDSLGDVLAFANPVFDAANRNRVGSDNGSCVRTKVAHSYECAWTTTLRGGSVAVEGPFYDNGDSILTVTGGTGRFMGARGQMRLHARNAAGSSYDFSYTLLR